MPILVEILTGSRRGHRVVLDKPIITLGRHPDNDVVFDPHAEPLVSAFHCEIRETGSGRFLVIDRGSSNGTWIGGQSVMRASMEGRTEVALAQNGPIVAVMPMDVVPAQAADAPSGGGARPGGHRAFDPMVIAPTPDGGAGGPLGRHQGSPGGAATERFERPIAPPIAAASDLGAATKVLGDLAPCPPSRPQPGVAAPAGIPIVPPDSRGGPTGRTRTTAYLRAVASEMLKRSSRRFIVTIVVLVVLLLGAATFVTLVATGWITLSGPDRDSARGSAAPPPGPAPSDAVVSGAVDGAAAGRPAGLTPQEIVERNRDAIFVLGVSIGDRSEGFCTGFAITERILATNAHCIVEMERIWRQVLVPGQGVYAFQNEHPGVRYRVEYALRHPDYAADESADEITPDIGLAVIDGRSDEQVRLADKQSAARLRAGDRIYLIGFPGTLINTDSPVATLTEGVVSRLTDLAQRKADPAGSVLIQHSAFTTKGTSGSPLFDETGEVIGINTGYYRGEATQQRIDPVTGRTLDETVSQDLQNYAIGMRVDMLQDLLRLLYERIEGSEEPGMRVPGQ